MTKTNSKESVLDPFKLGYEDIKPRKRKIAKKSSSKKNVLVTNTKSKRRSVRGFIIPKFKAVHKSVTSTVNKLHKTDKKAKKMTKIERETAQLCAKKQRNNVIIGIGLLLVVVSIAYSTYIVRTFVNTGVSLIALVPQVAFALSISIKAFSRLYK